MSDTDTDLDGSVTDADIRRAALEAAARVRQRLGPLGPLGTAMPHPPVYRGDVLFTLAAEIQQIGAEWKALKAFEARVWEAHNSAAAWMALRDELNAAVGR